MRANALPFPLLRPLGAATPGALLRAIFAGSAWGVSVAAGLTAMKFWNCGIVCIPEVIDTTLMATAAGIVAIGPLAIFSRASGATPPRHIALATQSK